MPPKQKPFAELGGVDRVDTCFRADLRYRTPTGQQVHIHGPRRERRHRAQRDLEDMRAAGAVGSTREKGLEIMAAEARRIQLSAHFEAEARAAQQRQREEELAAEEDAMSEVEPDDEPWLMDYPSPREDVAPTPAEKLPLTPAQATEALETFRPIKACPADLEHLLQCRADPNMPIKEGNISPLRNVIAFARSEVHLEKMRQLLLDYGANESKEDRERLVTTQKAFLFDAMRIREARDLDTPDYDPTGSAMESQW